MATHYWCLFLLLQITATTTGDDVLYHPSASYYERTNDLVWPDSEEQQDQSDIYDNGDEAYVLDDDSDDYVVEKRHLGALARSGDKIASKIRAHYGSSSGGHEVAQDWSTFKNLADKRHIGSLVGSGNYAKLLMAAKNDDNSNPTKKFTNKPVEEEEEDDEEQLAMDTNLTDDNDDDLYSINKKNIAALARRGTFTKLRMQRRPVPWINDDNNHQLLNNNWRQSPTENYKRNIQSFFRIHVPGSGFRSLLREQLRPRKVHQHKPSSPKTQPYAGLFGKGNVRGRDRFRGTRSTQDHYGMLMSPPSATTSHRFRPPMAFVSRHVWKRAIRDMMEPFLVTADDLQHHRISSDDIEEENDESSSGTEKPSQVGTTPMANTNRHGEA